MPYIVQADLENALGSHVVKTLFCDDNSEVVNVAALAACLAYASAQVDAFLAGNYAITLPIASPPDIVKFAAVDFACAYAVRRRPEIMSAMGAKSWTDFHDAALANMKLYSTGLARLPVATAASPANVGGFGIDETSRIAIANADGTSNSGDW
jgi:phage gp36-like protein